MNKKKNTYLSTQNFAIKIFVKRHKHFIFSEFDFVATVYVYIYIYIYAFSRRFMSQINKYC